MKLPAKKDAKTLALVALLGIMILYVYFMYIFGPLSREASKVGGEVKQAQAQLKSLQTATANEAALKEQYRQVDETVSALRRALPTEQELPAVIEFLSSLATKTDVKIQTIFPQRAPEAPGARREAAKPAAPEQKAVHTDVLIQIDALAGFHEFGTFLSLVETGERPMQVASLRVTSSTKGTDRHTINLVLRSYFAVTDESAPPPAAARSGAPRS
jgi:Tfp pilus assembly protein PilO